MATGDRQVRSVENEIRAESISMKSVGIPKCLYVLFVVLIVASQTLARFAFRSQFVDALFVHTNATSTPDRGGGANDLIN